MQSRPDSGSERPSWPADTPRLAADPTPFTGQAAAADPHDLYERSVQCTEAEVDFFEQRFLRLSGRKARILREDFCGTAALCREWVKRHPLNGALGIDIDPDVLDWGRRRCRDELQPADAERVHLVAGDVLQESAARALPRPDLVAAMNFSYWLCTERDRLREYFAAVRSSLADDGVLFLDAYGGYDAFREIVEEREIEDDRGRFTYLWEQDDYNPITGAMTCFIHFGFSDGSRLERAFAYQWRLWTLPEIRELLAEAGFGRVTCWWQGWTEDGEPDGDFRPTLKADADAGWICYISAEKRLPAGAAPVP
jgi:hypothetical protein